MFVGEVLELYELFQVDEVASTLPPDTHKSLFGNFSETPPVQGRNRVSEQIPRGIPTFLTPVGLMCSGTAQPGNDKALCGCQGERSFARNLIT